MSRAPLTFGELSRSSNARTAGYLIAEKAFFSVSRVSRVAYLDQHGAQRTLSGTGLRRLQAAYR